MIFFPKILLCQCVETENGDSISIKLIIDSDFYEEDYIKESFLDCENCLKLKDKSFTEVEMEQNTISTLYFYNITYDTIYSYEIEKKSINWKIKSYENNFSHIILDGDDIVFSFQTGCTIFHAKFYNPKDDEADENFLWLKTWKDAD